MAALPRPSDANSSYGWLESADGSRWPLLGNCHLGRAPENHIVIDHPKASRLHAAIHAQDETEFWLLDLGSRNGTYLNKHRLLQPTLLRDGDVLKVAGQTFSFRQPPAKRSRTGTTVQLDHTTTAEGITVIDLRHQSVWLLIADIEKFTQLSQEWRPDKLAESVGCWLRDSRTIIADRHGRITKYLGDGFLGCWEDDAQATARIAATLTEFQKLRKDSEIKFRVALHYGAIAFGGHSEMGEESMLGPELNFIFRLEALASKLGISFCLSTPANNQLAGIIPTRRADGEYELKGFEGVLTKSLRRSNRPSPRHVPQPRAGR